MTYKDLHEKHGDIRIKCEGSATLPIDAIMDLQGNLKKRSKKNKLRLAERIFRLGFIAPFFIWDHDGEYFCLDGHGRSDVLCDIRKAGIPIPGAFPVAYIQAKDEQEAKEILLSVSSQYGDFDKDELKEWLSTFDDEIRESLRFLDRELNISIPVQIADDDEVPEQVEAITKPGDLWELGTHRLLCGDSTDKENIERLMAGEKACVLHSDPPYGMNKEFENDNQHKENLVKFQVKYFRSVIDFLTENASFYVWGNAEDLWRLWYNKDFQEIDRLTFRNEIVWDKNSCIGITAADRRMWSPITERCLFFMRGQQTVNENADNYWEGWESVRKYLYDQRMIMGWDVPTMKRIAGHSDLSGDHWTGKSQWNMPTEEVYNRFREAARNKAFKKEYEEIKKEYEEINKEYEEIKKEFYKTRAYFDSEHSKDIRDVLRFDRVQGKDRHGHPTPKPVDMLELIMKTSATKTSIILDPFLGSGSTLIAYEKTGRRCYGLELDPDYCDVIVQRYQDWCDKNDRQPEIKRNGDIYR